MREARLIFREIENPGFSDSLKKNPENRETLENKLENAISKIEKTKKSFREREPDIERKLDQLLNAIEATEETKPAEEKPPDQPKPSWVKVLFEKIAEFFGFDLKAEEKTEKTDEPEEKEARNERVKIDRPTESESPAGEKGTVVKEKIEIKISSGRNEDPEYIKAFFNQYDLQSLFDSVTFDPNQKDLESGLRKLQIRSFGGNLILDDPENVLARRFWLTPVSRSGGEFLIENRGDSFKITKQGGEEIIFRKNPAGVYEIAKKPEMSKLNGMNAEDVFAKIGVRTIGDKIESERLSSKPSHWDDLDLAGKNRVLRVLGEAEKHMADLKLGWASRGEIEYIPKKGATMLSSPLEKQVFEEAWKKLREDEKSKEREEKNERKENAEGSVENVRREFERFKTALETDGPIPGTWSAFSDFSHAQAFAVLHAQDAIGKGADSANQLKKWIDPDGRMSNTVIRTPDGTEYKCKFGLTTEFYSDGAKGINFWGIALDPPLEKNKITSRLPEEQKAEKRRLQEIHERAVPMAQELEGILERVREAIRPIADGSEKYEKNALAREARPVEEFVKNIKDVELFREVLKLINKDSFYVEGEKHELTISISDGSSPSGWLFRLKPSVKIYDRKELEREAEEDL